jgi:hypothetical protein
LNGPKVRRGIARAVLTGSDLAAETGKEARRVTAQMVEDFEDALAEVKAEKAQAQAEAQSIHELAAQVRQIRADVSSIASRSFESKTGPVQ